MNKIKNLRDLDVEKQKLKNEISLHELDYQNKLLLFKQTFSFRELWKFIFSENEKKFVGESAKRTDSGKNFLKALFSFKSYYRSIKNLFD